MAPFKTVFAVPLVVDFEPSGVLCAGSARRSHSRWRRLT